MSEELFNSASCSGDCADCGSDCQDLDQPTVTLTLDDDTEVKCAVLTIFPAPNQKEYIALLPLDENGENEDGEKAYILAPEGLKVGMKVMSGAAAEVRPGNCLPLSE